MWDARLQRSDAALKAILMQEEEVHLHQLAKSSGDRALEAGGVD